MKNIDLDYLNLLRNEISRKRNLINDIVRLDESTPRVVGNLSKKPSVVLLERQAIYSQTKSQRRIKIQKTFLKSQKWRQMIS